MPSKSSAPAIVWFRRDLRLSDNPALHAAIQTGKPLLLLYILEETNGNARAPGAASRWWLDKSLASLSSKIAALGGALVLRAGKVSQILNDLITETGADAVYWNRRYSQPDQDNDKALKSKLKSDGVDVQSFNGSLLTEPWTQTTGSGGYYKVFTPYWRSVRQSYEPPEAHPRPEKLNCLKVASETLADWGLHPEAPDWSTGFDPVWTPGEDGAVDRLDSFLSDGLTNYQNGRNRPDLATGTSGLSPHLAHGEISPAQIWRSVRQAMQDGRRSINESSAWTFLSEIGWREFSYVLLFHNPDLATENYNKSFQHMPWRQSQSDYARWCHGQTGYPMVDAGMRQLWQTGWMHNRVRMITASFLTKHLLLPWQLGEKWFWDTLVDADPAANAASWQWTAGSGADAAPYFRVFNPITQGPKFDETGDYARQYCPELVDLPLKYLHQPWEAPEDVLEKAGVKLGTTYPKPMIAHKKGRERALAAYDELKKKREA